MTNAHAEFEKKFKEGWYAAIAEFQKLMPCGHLMWALQPVNEFYNNGFEKHLRCLLCIKDAEIAEARKRITSQDLELVEWRNTNWFRQVKKLQNECTDWMQQDHAARERIRELERLKETTLDALNNCHGRALKLEVQVKAAPPIPLEWRGLPREIVDFFLAYRRWLGYNAAKGGPVEITLTEAHKKAL